MPRPNTFLIIYLVLRPQLHALMEAFVFATQEPRNAIKVALSVMNSLAMKLKLNVRIILPDIAKLVLYTVLIMTQSHALRNLKWTDLLRPCMVRRPQLSAKTEVYVLAILEPSDAPIMVLFVTKKKAMRLKFRVLMEASNSVMSEPLLVSTIMQ